MIKSFTLKIRLREACVVSLQTHVDRKCHVANTSPRVPYGTPTIIIRTKFVGTHVSMRQREADTRRREADARAPTYLLNGNCCLLTIVSPSPSDFQGIYMPLTITHYRSPGWSPVELYSILFLLLFHLLFLTRMPAMGNNISSWQVKINAVYPGTSFLTGPLSGHHTFFNYLHLGKVGNLSSAFLFTTKNLNFIINKKQVAL